MTPPSSKTKIIGGKNFWLWSEGQGYDMTHPSDPNDPLIYPRITLATRKEQATIDPGKTALVVSDMQNYFLSPLLDRRPKSVGIDIVKKLVAKVIPASRKAGIPVIWLCWGLDESDLDDIPPSIARGYDFPCDQNFTKPRFLGSLGHDIGQIRLPNNDTIEAGRVMMRGQWNTALYPPLAAVVESQDIWINKNRLSGFW
ncbi:hypothetical protein S40293_02268 [Stachybotrys chartarum IBT 40293]|nr:hypothetical protein S40293_02268 [Stachybotrys chartarum IBT 40293]